MSTYHPITVRMFKAGRALVTQQYRPEAARHHAPVRLLVRAPLATPLTFVGPESTMELTERLIETWWEPCFVGQSGRDWITHEERHFARFVRWRCLNPLVADEYWEEGV